MATFKKKFPIISFDDFIKKAKDVKKFTSSRGMRYEVIDVKNNEYIFKRLDANTKINWEMDLEKVYQAYISLDDFATKNFKPFIPVRHSPARGLLIHLKMTE